MSEQAMRLDRDGGLARLTFTQAARGNPVDGQFCAEFCEIANTLSADDTVRCVLIGAEGRAFSVGGDIAMFVAHLDDLPRQIRRWTADLHMGIARLQRMDAPIVAAVHGVCAGGMVGMMAGADIVVAEAGTRFIAAYAGIGYCCDAGTSAMLTRRMGPARTRKYLLLNETLETGEAVSAGLVDEVAPAGSLKRQALAIARKLADGPTAAYGAMRRLLLSAQTEPLDVQLELEAQALAGITATHDAREGLTAFAAKRPAVFTGR